MRYRLPVLIGLVTLLVLGCEAGADGPKTASAGRPATQPNTPDGKVVLSDDQWKKILTPTQFNILREKGTERAFENAYFNNHDKGVYVCAACGELLFDSDTKFESGTGWPSFFAPVAKDHVTLSTDADGSRTEVTCPRCGGHLGHVFTDGPQPTGQRFCMNSGAMLFQPTTRPTK